MAVSRTSDDLDIAIIGGGPAGVSCALAAKELGLEVVLVESSGIGGQLLNLDEARFVPLSNEPQAGYDLAAQLGESADAAAIDVRLFAECDELTRAAGGWSLSVDGAQIRARNVVLATGTHPEEPEGGWAEKFLGAGVSHCAACDGPLYAGRAVALVGGSPWTLAEATSLSQHASEILVLIPAGEDLAPELGERAGLDPAKVQIVREARNIEVTGGSAVESLSYKDAGGNPVARDIGGVFLGTSRSPNTTLVAGLVDTDERGFVMVDSNMRSSAENLYAVGEVRAGSAPLLTVVTADGVVAAAHIAGLLGGGMR